MLRDLDLDLRPLYIIDTSKAAQYVLQLHPRYGLGEPLGVLGIPYALLRVGSYRVQECAGSGLSEGCHPCVTSSPATTSNRTARLEFITFGE